MKKINNIKMSIIIVLCMCAIIFAKDRGYSFKEGLPGINKYPIEIQRLDSLKTDYFMNFCDSKGRLIKDVPSEYIEKFAGVFIDCFLQHDNIYRKGYSYEYIKESYPMGLEMAGKLFSLGYPWDLLLEKKGFVLAKIIDDRIMPKMESLIRDHPNSRVNEYVLTAQVIEDIFGTCNSDTIYVRHNESILNAHPEYIDMNILLSFRSRASIQRADSIQYIYLIGGKNEYMFVKDNTIYDPNNILNEKNEGYKKFKEDLFAVLPKTSKAKKQQ